MPKKYDLIAIGGRALWQELRVNGAWLYPELPATPKAGSSQANDMPINM